MKLIAGKMNIPYIKCRPGKAIGAKIKRGQGKLKTDQVVAFNTPTIILRKEA